MVCYSENIISKHRRRIAKKRSLMKQSAKMAARILKDKFELKRIILVGSVAGDKPLSVWSDIDLAVEGLSSIDLLSARSELSSISDFSFDVKAIEDMDNKSKEIILEKGVLLYEQ